MKYLALAGLLLLFVQVILSGVGGIQAFEGYELSSGVSLLHADLRDIEYIRYLGGGLAVLASAGLSKLFIVNTSSGEIVSAIVLPFSGDIGEITHIGLYDGLLVVTGKYGTVVFQMNSSSENIYYLARRDHVLGYYGGELNNTIVLYDKSRYILYDPVSGSVDKRLVEDHLYVLTASGDRIYGVRYRDDDHMYLLTVWNVSGGSWDYPITGGEYYDVYGLSVSPDGSLAAVVLGKHDNYIMYIVDINANTSTEATSWSVFSLRRLVWLDDNDILIVKTYGFSLYKIGEGIVYDSGEDMLLTWYIEGGYVVRGKDKLTLYAYENGSIVEKANLTLRSDRVIRRVQVIGGFVYNDRIYLAVDVWFQGSKGREGGFVCFDMNGSQVYSLLSSIEAVYAVTSNGYLVELLHDWVSGFHGLRITSEGGGVYAINVSKGDFRFLFMTDRLIGYEVKDPPVTHVYVYDYLTGEPVYADSFRTLKDLSTYGSLGDMTALGYYDSYNRTVHIVVFRGDDVYITWNTTMSLNDIVIDGKVYLVGPSKVIVFDPYTMTTREISSGKLSNALGLQGAVINLEAAALTSKGLFLQGYEARSYDAVAALLNASSLDIISIDIIDKDGRVIPGFHPISLGDYVVAYMEGYTPLSLDTLQPVDIEGLFLAASSYTGYLYTLQSPNSQGMYEYLVIYNPDGSIVGRKKLPMPVEPSSIPPNCIKATGKYLVFLANGDYVIVYDAYNDEFYTIYTSGRCNDPISISSDRLAIALPIGTLIIGEQMPPPGQKVPQQNTTTTTTSSTTTSTNTESRETTTTTTMTTETQTAVTTTTTTTQETTETTGETGQTGVSSYSVVIAVAIVVAIIGIYIYIKR